MLGDRGESSRPQGRQRPVWQLCGEVPLLTDCLPTFPYSWTLGPHRGVITIQKPHLAHLPPRELASVPHLASNGSHHILLRFLVLLSALTYDHKCFFCQDPHSGWNKRGSQCTLIVTIGLGITSTVHKSHWACVRQEKISI